MSAAAKLLAPLTRVQVRDLHQRIRVARDEQLAARQFEDSEGEIAATQAIDQLLEMLPKR